MINISQQIDKNFFSKIIQKIFKKIEFFLNKLARIIRRLIIYDLNLKKEKNLKSY